MTKPTTTEAVTKTATKTLKLSFPYAMVLTAIMGVAKFGLGLAIPLWFVLLPLYFGVAVLLGIVALIGAGFLLVAAFCGIAWAILSVLQFFHERRHERRRREAREKLDAIFGRAVYAR